MNRIDFSPLYRSSVGFDRLFSLLDNLTPGDNGNAYPPYNIEIIGENRYRISMAVAGFREDDLSVEVKDNTLIVSVDKKNEDEAEKRVFLHQGLAERSFSRRFRLADHVQVEGADLENGILNIDLIRELPEAMKPRRIAIGGATKGAVGGAAKGVIDSDAA